MGRSVDDPELFFAELERRLAARSRDTIDDDALTEACVLVPLIDEPDGPRVLFTRRPETLAHHAGQVSFPGGVREPTDASALDAALREAEEELAIPRARVRSLGALDDVWVVTGYRLTPFVGRVPGDVCIEPNEAEVARAFTVPLAELADPTKTKTKVVRMERAGRVLDVPFFEHSGEVIWGATGRALQNLLEVALGWVAPEPIS